MFHSSEEVPAAAPRDDDEAKDKDKSGVVNQEPCDRDSSYSLIVEGSLGPPDAPVMTSGSLTGTNCASCPGVRFASE